MLVFAGNAAYEVSPGIVGLANNLTQKKRNNKLSSGFSGLLLITIGTVACLLFSSVLRSNTCSILMHCTTPSISYQKTCNKPAL